MIEREKPTPWRKSSRSNDSHGQCVEARKSPSGFQVRDSKLMDESPRLTLSTGDFSSLVLHLK